MDFHFVVNGLIRSSNTNRANKLQNPFFLDHPIRSTGNCQSVPNYFAIVRNVMRLCSRTWYNDISKKYPYFEEKDFMASKMYQIMT